MNKEQIIHENAISQFLIEIKMKTLYEYSADEFEKYEGKMFDDIYEFILDEIILDYSVTDEYVPKIVNTKYNKDKMALMKSCFSEEYPFIDYLSSVNENYLEIIYNFLLKIYNDDYYNLEDVDDYIKSENFTPQQLEIILEAYISGVSLDDISLLANPEIESQDMIYISSVFCNKKKDYSSYINIINEIKKYQK